jgi:hypothetical protein
MQYLGFSSFVLSSRSRPVKPRVIWYLQRDGSNSWSVRGQEPCERCCADMAGTRVSIPTMHVAVRDSRSEINPMWRESQLSLHRSHLTHTHKPHGEAQDSSRSTGRSLASAQILECTAEEYRDSYGRFVSGTHLTVPLGTSRKMTSASHVRQKRSST